MGQLDGQNTWTEFSNAIPIEGRSKYHRLNVCFQNGEPPLDDVTVMEEMKKRAVESVRNDERLQPLLDSILSSLFYFELQSLPHFTAGEYHCFGRIYCRLKNASLPLDRLVWRLIQTEAKFVLLGRPILCVEQANIAGKSYARFGKAVRFNVPSLYCKIYISLKGITARAKEISGFPMTVADLITLQSLDMPFGRCDHAIKEDFEKPLPELPARRKRQRT